MGNFAQLHSPRGQRRGAGTGGVTARDLMAEKVDLLDDRDREPGHLAMDAKREQEDRFLAACDAYHDRVRANGQPTERLAERLDPEPIIEAAADVIRHLSRLTPSPSDDADGLSGWLHDAALYEVMETCYRMRWRSVERAFDALHAFANGGYGPSLATTAQELLARVDPWLVVAYARHLPGLHDVWRGG